MEAQEHTALSDERLIELAIAGDALAFESLFNRYREAIYQLQMQRTAGRSDDVDDLIQETFIKVYLNLHRYNNNYTFGQWVYTIARNTFIDYVRRKREETCPFEGAAESAASYSVGHNITPEQSLINNQSRARLERLIERMSPRYRALIDLRFFREFSYEEIATELQLPMGTVKTQIHRAREQLCTLITNDSEPIL